MKSYAVETANPTIERVTKVTSYGTEKVHSAKAYSMDKVKGMFLPFRYFLSRLCVLCFSA